MVLSSLVRIKSLRGNRDQMKFSRWGAVIITSLLVSCQSSLHENIQRNRQNFLEIERRVQIELVGELCQVGMDSLSIPRLKASSKRPLLACLGRTQARHRAWQMDYFRRIALGKASEVLGGDFLKADFLMRVLEIERRAMTAFQTLPDENQMDLMAFTVGVNLGLREALEKGVYEFKDFHYFPEKWLPHHSIALMYLQSFYQTQKSLGKEMEEVDLLSILGEKALSLFDRTDGVPWHTTILKPGEHPVRPTTSLEKKKPNFSGFPGSVANQWEIPSEMNFSEGSNSWVLSKKRSLTGNAWLANDPHLRITRPMFWFWTQLISKDLNVVGATFPGVPAMMSGVNPKLSWGVTNSYVDVIDTALITPVEEKTLISKRPLIWVKWAGIRLPFFFKTYQITQEGFPVLPNRKVDGKPIAIRWSGFELDALDLERLYSLLKAKSIEEADLHLAPITTPSWNLVFADTEGKIGYRTIGLLPKKRISSPRGVFGSDLNALRWEYLSSEEAPRLLNPKRGYIVTANNSQWSSSSKYTLGRGAESFLPSVSNRRVTLERKKT